MRQNMSVAKASNCTNFGVCVICPLLARVSSMWGFGGNLRGGLHIMDEVYKPEWVHIEKRNYETQKSI